MNLLMAAMVPMVTALRMLTASGTDLLTERLLAQQEVRTLSLVRRGVRGAAGVGSRFRNSCAQPPASAVRLLLARAPRNRLAADTRHTV
jgi:hypothetical protein